MKCFNLIFLNYIFFFFRYINFLKETCKFREGKPLVNKSLDDPWTFYGSNSRSKGTQTAINNVSLKNQVVHQTSTAVRGKVVQTLTPDVTTQKTPWQHPQHPPRPQPENNTGNLFINNDQNVRKQIKIAPNSLQKPITIMAKDPNTGAVRPVTFVPKVRLFLYILI